MDNMEHMEVLQRTDEVGVVHSFVMLTPLNIQIKKLPTVSPTIDQTKQKLAKYNIEMDLSNYFWKQGMRVEDNQYLGTLQPFKCLRIYVVEPPGLRNAIEHAYERLARIFGDLCSD